LLNPLNHVEDQILSSVGAAILAAWTGRPVSTKFASAASRTWP